MLKLTEEQIKDLVKEPGVLSIFPANAYIEIRGDDYHANKFIVFTKLLPKQELAFERLMAICACLESRDIYVSVAGDGAISVHVHGVKLKTLLDLADTTLA